jgi:hypothetical protein
MDCLQGSVASLLEHQPPLDPGHSSDGLFSRPRDFDIVHSSGKRTITVRQRTFLLEPTWVFSKGTRSGSSQRDLQAAVESSETRRDDVVIPPSDPPFELPHVATSHGLCSRQKPDRGAAASQNASHLHSCIVQIASCQHNQWEESTHRGRLKSTIEENCIDSCTLCQACI